MRVYVSCISFLIFGINLTNGFHSQLVWAESPSSISAHIQQHIDDLQKSCWKNHCLIVWWMFLMERSISQMLKPWRISSRAPQMQLSTDRFLAGSASMAPVAIEDLSFMWMFAEHEPGELILSLVVPYVSALCPASILIADYLEVEIETLTNPMISMHLQSKYRSLLPRVLQILCQLCRNDTPVDI